MSWLDPRPPGRSGIGRIWSAALGHVCSDLAVPSLEKESGTAARDTRDDLDWLPRVLSTPSTNLFYLPLQRYALLPRGMHRQRHQKQWNPRSDLAVVKSAEPATPGRAGPRDRPRCFRVT